MAATVTPATSHARAKLRGMLDATEIADRVAPDATQPPILAPSYDELRLRAAQLWSKIKDLLGDDFAPGACAEISIRYLICTELMEVRKEAAEGGLRRGFYAAKTVISGSAA